MQEEAWERSKSEREGTGKRGGRVNKGKEDVQKNGYVNGAICNKQMKKKEIKVEGEGISEQRGKVKKKTRKKGENRIIDAFMAIISDYSESPHFHGHFVIIPPPPK